MATLDPEVIRHALKTARERGFAEVELETADGAFRASLEPQKKKVAPKATGPVALSSDERRPLKASLVGFLQTTNLKVGQQVQKGAPIAVVSALGLANEVEANIAGEVLEVLVEAGQPVEYGQILAWVRP